MRDISRTGREKCRKKCMNKSEPSTRLAFFIFLIEKIYIMCYNVNDMTIPKGDTMKKTAFILIVVMLFLNLVSCNIIGGNKEDNNGLQIPPEDSSETPDNPDTPENPDIPETPDDPNTDPGEEDNENVNEHLILVNSIDGLNEEIMINISIVEGFAYNIYYCHEDETEYSKLDENLIIEKKDNLECYILGIKKGNYRVKVEAESATRYASKTFDNIYVESQDRSGYAHFGYSDGIGAYNNDGTVKEGTVILYVTNENKNTITMTINGTEYVGLVDIMQKLYQCDTPVLIRVIGKITTNQWNYKNVEPRLVDGSNATDDFFENTFSTEYGENLANLKVRYTDKKDGKTYTYRTTPEGLGEVRVSGSGTSTTTYKGSSFPRLLGKTVYDDDSFINVIEVQAASNVTIEGVGSDAEFFQFGVGFEECQSIEVKNLTFTNYPEDALNFMVDSDKGVEAFGNYWVHNNTFNAGYNAWDITGERDKYAGDGTIDMAFVHNVSISYNFFNGCRKTMLVGNADSSRCMNISIHHNYFYKVGSRIPLVRNTNVHSFNNYFDGCSTCASVRVSSYLFSEANYYKSCSKPIDINGGVAKSYGDIFVSSNVGNATIVTTRGEIVSNNCKPDKKTDYSRFDTDATLFYYDAEQGVTIADYLLSAEDVSDFVIKYAGAGVKAQLSASKE